jgi:hypothetical protein
LEHGPHLLVNQVDRFQWADHHFEVDDLSLVVPFDHVDAIDQETIDSHFELQRSIPLADDFPNVAKLALKEDVECCSKVLRGDGLPYLGRMNYRRMKHGILGQKIIQRFDVTGVNQGRSIKSP